MKFQLSKAVSEVAEAEAAIDIGTLHSFGARVEKDSKERQDSDRKEPDWRRDVDEHAEGQEHGANECGKEDERKESRGLFNEMVKADVPRIR